MMNTVFPETDRGQAHARWREVADNLHDRFKAERRLRADCGHRMFPGQVKFIVHAHRAPGDRGHRRG
jgi:hypothetical protein